MDDISQFYESAVKKVAGGALLIFGGAIVAKFTGFLRQFIVIRMLSPSQYGLFALGLTFLNLSAGLGCLGLYLGAQRYIAYHDALDDNSSIKGVIRATLRIIALSGFSIFALLIVLAKPISTFMDKPEFRNILLIYCLAIPLMMYGQVIVSFFYGFRRTDVAVILNEVLFGVLSVVLILFALLIHRETYSAVFALVVTSLLVLVVSAYLYWRIIHPRLRNVNATPVTKSLLLFSLPLFLSGISYIVLNNTDTLMLGYYMPADAVGYYNAAFLLMTLMALFLNSFAVIFMPVLSGLVAKGLDQEVKRIYKTVTKWIFLFTFPLILTFFFFPRQVLTSLFSSPYGQASTALAILVAAELLHTSLGPNEQALVAYGSTRLLLLSYSATAISNIVLNMVLIPRIGISGAAAATGVSLVILNIFNSSFLYLKFKVHPFGKSLLVPGAMSIAAAGALYVPMRSLVNVSPWLSYLCYPIFLILGGLFTLITRSFSDDDMIVYRAIKARIKKSR